jgi:hypothetical protein
MALSNELSRLAHGNRGEAGEYRLLHKYLRDRFADRVVLTFGEIEDLLGFPLPELAWRESAWWNGADAAGASPTHREAWTLASRTAVVNLVSKRVTFDRQLSRGA